MSLHATWYNELGSMMILAVNGDNLSGTYHTKVGDATGVYPLVGKTNTLSSGEDQAIGWVVVWQNEYGSSDSVTTWSGQYRLLENGDELIVTTWLLTSETDSNDDWKSTLVGKDTFSKNPPPPEIVNKNITKGIQHSNPTSTL